MNKTVFSTNVQALGKYCNNNNSNIIIIIVIIIIVIIIIIIIIITLFKCLMYLALLC